MSQENERQYIVKMLDNIRDDIKILDKKVEKIRDKIFQPKILYGFGSLVITILLGLAVFVGKLDSEIAINKTKIETITEKVDKLPQPYKIKEYKNKKSGTKSVIKYYNDPNVAVKEFKDPKTGKITIIQMKDNK